MPFAQQVPGKTSFWEGSEKGRTGEASGQVGAAPGALNKHRTAHSKREPGPGPSPSRAQLASHSYPPAHRRRPVVMESRDGRACVSGLGFCCCNSIAET